MFQRDLFSKSSIEWNNKNLLADPKLRQLTNKLETLRFGKIKYIKKKEGININSQNFKIRIGTKDYLIKKWSSHLKIKEINSILNLHKKLKSLNIHVPKIKSIFKKDYVKINNDYWTVFEFIKSNHFTGSKDQFRLFSIMTGKFYKELKNIKIKEKRINYYNKNNYQIIKTIKSQKKNFKNFFNKKLGKKVLNNLDQIEQIYLSNSKQKLKKQWYQLSHLDLHPHNIISNNKKIFFLDIESCHPINPGFAIAFSCLKICKQTIIKNKIKSNLERRKLVKIFNHLVSQNYPEIDKLDKRYYYYSTSEVLRRILIIFKLNLIGNKKWNKVLDIQIDHLEECRILFR